MKRFYPVVLMFALCGVHGFARTIAPQTQSPPTPTNLAVEIHNAKERPTFISGNGSVWFGRFGRIPGWRPPANFLPVRAVDFSSRAVNETTLKIKVSLHRGEQQFDEQTTVAVYEVREGETVVVEELKQFGLLSFELKVVRTKRQPNALPYVESPTTALALVGVERFDTPFPSYKVRLRNLSGKDIAALDVQYLTDKGSRRLTRARHPDDRPLIKAGEVFDLRASGGSDGDITADGYVPDGLQRVFIPTVLFTDETFEGERAPAVEMIALKHGRRLQLTRALALVNNSLQTTDAGGEAASVARFKAQVAALTEEVEPQTIEILEAKFPALSSSEKSKLRDGVRYYLHRVKTDLLKSVREFEGARGGVDSGSRKITFHRWLVGIKENYEQWLARL